jgi:hypothetical protein
MWIPFHTFCMQTQYTAEEIARKFKSIVNEERPIFKRMYANDEFSNKPFCGRIIGYQFKMSEIISHGNPILPIINIHIEEISNSTFVKFTFRISIFTAILMLLWIMLGIFMCIFSKAWVPFFIILFGYLAVIVPFNIQSKKLKNYFSKLVS